MSIPDSHSKPGRLASFFNLKAAYQGLVNSPYYQTKTWQSFRAAQVSIQSMAKNI